MDFATLFTKQYDKAKPSVMKSLNDDFLPDDQINDNLDDDSYSSGENDNDSEYRLKCCTVIKRSRSPESTQIDKIQETQRS